MTAKRILIVEDEKAIRDMVAFGLRRAGYEVREAEDCREARARIVDVRPDLMLVDWMLPDMSGLELTRSLKRAKDTEEIPVIMLTARAEEQDKVGGLEGGADDYITKPFSPRELLARIQAVLRRAAPAGAADMVEVQGLKLDDSSHRVSAGRARNRPGAHRIPPAAFLHDPPGAGVHPRPVARPRLGGQYLRRGAHRGRAHPPAAQGARAVHTGRAGADRARRRLSILHTRLISGGSSPDHGSDVDFRARAARGHLAGWACVWAC